MALSLMKFTLMKNVVAMTLMSAFVFSPHLHAQNLLKDAVRMNRDLKDNKYKYKHEYKKTKHKVNRAADNARDLADGSYVDKKLDKMEHNASRKINRAKDRLDPRDEIAEEMRRDMNKRKREAVDKWLAD
ncbi:hypothetical protein MK852_14855 [Shewanella benthica]|uniref:hypothetical protein n=1 Tax=Shewanella benthica TaxID=43661 RepID=UPI001D0D6B2E|nr:hypothetical protein [Shewanella benthica]MCL1063390.1 hypothetical protein [Shewanella benthica]